MCKIDAPYGNHPIDEQKDPVERFNQALDEHQIEGKLHSLLNKHFSDSYLNVFGTISSLEDALSATKRHESESEKCVAILLSLKVTLISSFDSHTQYLPVRYKLVRDFSKDVAQTYFPDAPFELFSLGMNNVFFDYAQFVSKLYGEDYCYQEAFFNDASLTANTAYRTDILWDYFYSIAPILKSLEDDVEDVDLLKELCEIAHSSEIAGPPTKDSYQILQAIDFIKDWIKFDSRSGRLPESFTLFICSEKSAWGKIESLLRSNTSASEENSKKLKLWQEDTKLELERIFYVNAELKNASEEKIHEWANGLNYLILFNLYKGKEPSHIEPDDVRYCEIFDEICSELSSAQINTWLEWSVSQDIQQALQKPRRTRSFENSSKQWLRKKYLESWKNVFLALVRDIDYQHRLRIYSCYVTANGLQTDDFRSSFRTWWNSLLAEVITNDNFPKELLPDWTAIAIDRLAHDAALSPYVEKSIGILRGKLRQVGDAESEVEEYHSQLKKLLSFLDSSSPTKALRHRLLLMRSSTSAFSDEVISVHSSLTQENTSKWYFPLHELVKSQFAYQFNGQRVSTSAELPQAENDFYVMFCSGLAEFCLSRLRLRKGEKASNEKYEPHQATEQSSIWRQGYLKALSELGFDLNGNVHKTVNFIKKSDPEKDVREIASECYKAVRRGSKKTPSTQELRRGIISAEWWLLQCQRLELGLEINYEEALKTRRRLLRSPY